jgi:hypothetical protein
MGMSTVEQDEKNGSNGSNGSNDPEPEKEAESPGGYWVAPHISHL